MPHLTSVDDEIGSDVCPNTLMKRRSAFAVTEMLSTKFPACGVENTGVTMRFLTSMLVILASKY